LQTAIKLHMTSSPRPTGPLTPPIDSYGLFFWGYLERHTNRLANNTKAALIYSIMKQARKLDRAL
ncbi:Hypothetical protein FKW44_000731, partial [Caligus rogercresseyi]